jgi:hypothetical protein
VEKPPGGSLAFLIDSYGTTEARRRERWEVPACLGSRRLLVNMPSSRPEIVLCTEFFFFSSMAIYCSFSALSKIYCSIFNHVKPYLSSLFQ